MSVRLTENHRLQNAGVSRDRAGESARIRSDGAGDYASCTVQEQCFLRHCNSCEAVTTVDPPLLNPHLLPLSAQFGASHAFLHSRTSSLPPPPGLSGERIELW